LNPLLQDSSFDGRGCVQIFVSDSCISGTNCFEMQSSSLRHSNVLTACCKSGCFNDVIVLITALRKLTVAYSSRTLPIIVLLKVNQFHFDFHYRYQPTLQVLTLIRVFIIHFNC
jgi:hypothetical protein